MSSKSNPSAAWNQSVSIGILALCVAAGTAYILWRSDKNHKEKEKETKSEQKEKCVTVSKLNIYPIKSCSEVSVNCAQATARGFQYDRMAQVTDKNGKYCTPREEDKRKLFHVKPTLDNDKTIMTLSSPHVNQSFHLDLNSKTTSVSVEVLESPTKQTLQDYGDDVAKWLQDATNIEGCRFTAIGDDYTRSVQKNDAQNDNVPTTNPAPVSLADEAPYLLVNTSSLEDLNKRLVQRQKSPVDLRRFRPNIVITGLKPWEEDSLKKIQIGSSVQFHVWQRCGRCIMTTIDRDTLERREGPEPLSTLGTFRERSGGMRNFGMHLVPVEGWSEGEVCIGDEVKILEYDEERREEWMRLFGSK